MTSKFQLYSYGIVAEPKALSSKEILVTPLETMPFFDGEVMSDEAKIRDEFVDKDGKIYAVEVLSDYTIKATWIALGNDNRETPPDVRRGERVMIYRYETEDKFYWQSTGQDQGLRRLETVIYRFSDTTDDTVTKLTDKNSYWMEISTHKKSIQIQTVKNDGEAVEYGIKFDCATGKLIIKDDLGNHLYWDSPAHYMEMGNADESFIALDKKKILGVAADEIKFKTKQYIVEADKASFTVKEFFIKATSLIAKLSKFDIGGAGLFSGASLKHKAKNIGMTHTHTPPGGPPT